MNELPYNIEKLVLRYEPIKTDGLILHPILVKEYEDFLVARPALEVMHQSFPVAMMRIPLLSALYRMDYEAAAAGKTPSGLFSRALLALALALRLGEGLSLAERLNQFRIDINRGRPEELLRLRFTDTDGKEQTITPEQYKTLRRIVAAQNGVRVESDKANPQIVQAKKDMNAAGMRLNAQVEDLIAAVAAMTGTEERDIDQWPILRLEKRAEALRRILNYLVCGFGEMNGVSWKGGNPTPHPFFERVQDGAGLFTEFSQESKPMSGAVKQVVDSTQNFFR